MAKVVVIIQGRMGSTRLPGKTLMPILGEPMLGRMLERVKRAQKIDAIVLATSDSPENDAIAELGRKYNLGVFRGSEKDVLDRFYNAAKGAEADVVMRLTGDCPLMDPEVIDRVVTRFQEAKGAIDYCSTPLNYPEGLDTEVFPFLALEAAAREATLPSEREHVTLFIKNQPGRFKCDLWREGEGDHSTMHWSVDTQADFDFVTKIFEKLYPENSSFNKDDILTLLAQHPELLEINKGGTGYEGLAKSLKEDEELKNHP
jgi:spore coat polysaccharide biosynthesis protein SpsF